MALNTASRERTMSGKEGPPKGRVMSSLATRAIQSGGRDTPDLVLHIGDLSYAVTPTPSTVAPLLISL